MSHSPDPSLRKRDVEFMNVLARLIADQLEREESESERRQLEIRATGVGALLAALEARDGYTGDHSQSVLELSVAVARRLGLSEEEVADVERAALLHDVGKIGVPDSILNKPGPLDEGEWEQMRQHPAIGERIVAAIEGLEHMAPVIRAEHERWDGRGYPDGLEGEEIPLVSRIVFACDAFHAMTSDRPYRRATGIRAALEELERNTGKQFCPRTVPALVEVIERGHLSL
jgi:HD-GYP domain-containing protein (c-di-GMP phosphodiesterase class II)